RQDDEACRTTAEKLYKDLTDMGIEVLFDDRDVRAGVMFADADLLGVPVRVTIGPKALANGEIELSTRDKSVQLSVKKEEIIPEIKKLMDSLYEEINSKVKERI
ncbi:MAG: proline--tRNA ligase, partial [Lachnospiraceae bacterium]|nr:proline--tRNA ligase [Lachnospiraceae bacterium]